MNVKLLTISVFILLIFTSIFPIVNSMKVENKLEEIQIDINSEKKLKPYFPGISELDPNALYYYPYELILIFNKDYVDVENQKQFFGYNFTDVNPEINGALIEVPESEVEFLQQIIDHLTSLPQVEYANLNILDAVDPPNIVASSEKVTWGQETINCPGAWEISKGNSDV